ncbi:hypothetical protein GO308_08385 [Sphingomonas sp. SFZ2018-12]|nr:hypothetical protein [Sphingomonas sp. SFZ2018-12]
MPMSVSGGARRAAFRLRLSFAPVLLACLVAGCFEEGDPGVVTTVVETPQGTRQVSFRTDGETTPDDYAAALAMWRKVREKDSCVACHGADFFDLARIGTSDSEIVRRAMIDGASEVEARALVRGVKFVRTQFSLPAENPRTFRLLQPGGAVLPGATSAERDLALAGELARFMPVTTGAAPVRTLADAHRARDEFLAIDFDKLRVGVPFPLWSADIAHGPGEGTMDDWISDVPRIAIPARAAEWEALQNAYLADPSDFNFWKLYFGVETLTQPFAGLNPYDPADRWRVERISALKYRNALIGQHLMRSQAMGRTTFMRGQIAFAYLGKEAPFRAAFAGKRATLPDSGNGRLPEMLPNTIWELGDTARFGFDPSEASRGLPGNVGGKDAMRDRLRLLGFPQFVIDSVRPDATLRDETDAMQLSWFMLGLRFDPALQRVNGSNSTKVGEYLLSQLTLNDYFLHRTFQTGLRLVTRSYHPDADPKGATQPFNLKFNYFTAYNRHVPTRWNRKDNQALSATVRDAQLAEYKRITANFFRMSLLLHEEALDRGQIKPYGVSNQDGDYQVLKQFFDYAGQPGYAEDIALIRRVAAKSGTPLNF